MLYPRRSRGIHGAAILAALAMATLLAFSPVRAQETDPGPVPEWALVLHGGAGTIRREDMSPEEERAIRDAMTEALRAGERELAAGGGSVDAVESAIRVLEDSPLFNAGKGAVFTHDGANELDASIMDGTTRAAGAVAGVTHIQNPISLARLVMEESPHVLLTAEGAEEFALQQGMPLVPREYFHVQSRWEALERAREREVAAGTQSSAPAVEPILGTVGAVALDRNGNLAAGTSTGGMTNKRWGRVGDSPIIGAGTYADNEMGCAVSATGHGEFFIRNAVAHDICARKHYLEIPLADAADAVVMEDLVARGGDGGVIALDREGRIALPFNTEGMYRAHLVAGGEPVVEFYRD